MTLRDKQKAATRQKVLVAAEQAFTELGYEAASTREIARRVGGSTGAIFSSFGGKAEIYREVYGHDPITPEQGRALLLAAELTLAQGGPLRARVIQALEGAAGAVRNPATAQTREAA